MKTFHPITKIIFIWLLISPLFFPLLLGSVIPFTNSREPSKIVQELAPPPASHTVVNVSTIGELREALLNLESHTTLFLADGTYRLDDLPEKQLLTPYETFVEDIAIRGVSGDRNAVTLMGVGQFNNAAEFGIQIFNTKDVLIADLSIGQVFYHCISIHPEQGAAGVTLHNLRLFDAGEQLLKSNTDGTAEMDDLVIENCVFELTNGWDVHPEIGYAYGNGMSVQAMNNLVVRGCTFINLFYTTSALAGPAILVWRNSEGSLIEGNVFINCARGIALGLSEGGTGHSGGIIRNNFFYRQADIGAEVDVAIYVESPNAVVYHNTIIVCGSYYAPVEIRYSSVTNVAVKNNILDGGEIKLRDGASADIRDNIFEATNDWFVDMEQGDLHLVENAVTKAQVIDQGSSVDVPLDIDGEHRPHGSGVDLGADEFTGHYSEWNLTIPTGTSSEETQNLGLTFPILLVVGLLPLIIVVYWKRKKNLTQKLVKAVF